jgi:hypothetical protein
LPSGITRSLHRPSCPVVERPLQYNVLLSGTHQNPDLIALTVCSPPGPRSQTAVQLDPAGLLATSGSTTSSSVSSSLQSPALLPVEQAPHATAPAAAYDRPNLIQCSLSAPSLNSFLAIRRHRRWKGVGRVQTPTTAVSLAVVMWLAVVTWLWFKWRRLHFCTGSAVKPVGEAQTGGSVCGSSSVGWTSKEEK